MVPPNISKQREAEFINELINVTRVVLATVAEDDHPIRVNKSKRTKSHSWPLKQRLKKRSSNGTMMSLAHSQSTDPQLPKFPDMKRKLSLPLPPDYDEETESERRRRLRPTGMITTGGRGAARPQ